MAKNPVIQKARQEGYNNGFKNGFEQGKYSACVYFADRFEGLQDIKGIGPKTMEIVFNHFGSDFFQKVDGDGQHKKEEKKAEKIPKANEEGNSKSTL